MVTGNCKYIIPIIPLSILTFLLFRALEIVYEEELAACQTVYRDIFKNKDLDRRLYTGYMDVETISEKVEFSEEE